MAGLAPQFASDRLKCDPDVVLKAVAQSARAWPFADASLRSDRDFVVKAIAQSASALQFADASLSASSS